MKKRRARAKEQKPALDGRHIEELDRRRARRFARKLEDYRRRNGAGS